MAAPAVIVPFVAIVYAECTSIWRLPELVLPEIPKTLMLNGFGPMPTVLGSATAVLSVVVVEVPTSAQASRGMSTNAATSATPIRTLFAPRTAPLSSDRSIDVGFAAGGPAAARRPGTAQRFDPPPAGTMPA